MSFRFDQFTLDADTGRLLRGREEVHLSPKALQLLLTLVQNRHRAVSRADLQKELWPSTPASSEQVDNLVGTER